MLTLANNKILIEEDLRILLRTTYYSTYIYKVELINIY